MIGFSHTILRLCAAWYDVASPFFQSEFFAALFGALAGACSAYGLTYTTERRRELLKEISASNAAAELASGIAGTILNLKKQHLVGMLEFYLRQWQRYLGVLQLNQVQVPDHFAGPPGPMVFVFVCDFRSVSMPAIPAEELRQLLLDKVPQCTRAITFMMPLQSSLHSLTSSFARRHDAIAALQAEPEGDRVLSYFGLRKNSGITDENYPDALTGIEEHADGSIYFALRLCEVLIDHNLKLAAKCGRWAPKPMRKIRIAESFRQLLPNRANYPSFERILSEAKIEDRVVFEPDA